MTTRQNEVRRILRKLNGTEPDDGLVSRLANIAEAAEIAPGDALFPLMVALDYYAVMYEGMPERIKEASAFVLREHAEALRAETAKLAEEHKGQLEEATKALLAVSHQWMQKALPALIRDELKAAATDAVREPVNAAASRIEVMTRAAEQATSRLREAERSNTWTWVVGLLMAAMLAGVAGAGTLAWAEKHFAGPDLTKEQQTAIEWGNALQAAWPKLPAKVREEIKAASQGQ